MVTDALERALEATETKPQDGAAVALARALAQTIDGMESDVRQRMIAQTSGQLLAVLEALGMTPRARSGVVKGGQPDVGAARSKLDELRDRRSRRAAAVDTSTP